ncbi:hypothetical protein Dimus_024321 [Dionaea muscipula]
MENMMAKLHAMYGPSSSEVLEEIEAHRGSPTVSVEQEQQASQEQTAVGPSSGPYEHARPLVGETKRATDEED